MIWATARGPLTCSGLEGHVLVGGEESHELWHLDDLNASTLVDIEVSPGLWEVGGEVLLLGGTGKSRMGLKNLRGGGSGSTLGHDESTRWGTVLVLLLVGVGLDHGSHEDVIVVLGESWGNDSLVGTIDLTVHVWGEDLAGVVIIITIAFTIGTASIIVGNWVLFWVSVALVAIGAIAGRVLHSRNISKRDVNA